MRQRRTTRCLTGQGEQSGMQRTRKTAQDTGGGRIGAALGLFDDPYRKVDVAREKSDILTPANRTAAREIGRESIVLLTNRNVGGAPALPLRKDVRTLAVIGPLADDARSAIGAWSG